MKLEEFNISEVWLSPRFAVEQEAANGSTKIRAIDNMSWGPIPDEGVRKDNSINGYTVPTEKLKHETLDMLGAVMLQFQALMGVIPWLFKVDVDSAYRRVPIKPAHRWAAVIAFMLQGQVSACCMHTSGSTDCVLVRSGVRVEPLCFAVWSNFCGPCVAENWASCLLGGTQIPQDTLAAIC